MRETGAVTSSLSTEEERALAGAVRESVRRRVIHLVERAAEDVRTCPSCGQRMIILDRPQTFVRDPADGFVCAPCGAERDLVALYRWDADIGGEGG